MVSVIMAALLVASNTRLATHANHHWIPQQAMPQPIGQLDLTFQSSLHACNQETLNFEQGFYYASVIST